MEWEIRNWLLVPMNYVSTYSFVILSLVQYQTLYCLPKIQLLPIINLTHYSPLIQLSFTQSKWNMGERSIFLTFWKIHSCTKFFFIELEISNFIYLLIL